MMNVVILFLFLAASSYSAANEIGTVMLVRGEASILRSSGSEKIKVATRIGEGDLVETQAGAYVKIVMSDRNILVLVEKSKIKIDQYINSGDQKRVSLNLMRGSARHLVNERYNKNGQYYEVKTSTSVAGVRGTDFITEYNIESGDTVLCALSGIVSFDVTNDSADNKPLLVAAGNFIRLKATDAEPKIIETNKAWLEKALQVHTLEESAAFVPQIKLNSLLQFWYSDDSTPTATNARNNFRPRRVEFKLSSNTSENVRWFFTADLAKSLSTTSTTVMTTPSSTSTITELNSNGDNKVLQDMALAFRITPVLELLAGQLKIQGPSESFESSAELLLPERSIVSRTYGEKRDSGLQLSYKNDSLRGVLMISNGQAPNVNDTNTDKDASFRIDCRISSLFNLGAFGVVKGANYNEMDKYGLNFGVVSEEWIFKAEFANGYQSLIRNQGSVFDLGYKLNSELQFVSRYETFQSDLSISDISSAVSFGLNYFIEKNLSKIQLMHSVLKSFNGNFGTMNSSNGSNGAMTVVSFQAAF